MNTHDHRFSRRNFLWTAAAFTASASLLRSQERPAESVQPGGPSGGRSVVAVANGASRRENICAALAAIEDQIAPVLKAKKRVVIKPNIVSTSNQLASTHTDALHGIGINPEWVGYLGFCARAGLGQINLPNIDIRGTKLAEVTRKYQMHHDLERELRWIGPMKEIPEKLG